MAFTGRIGQSDSSLANIRLGYGATASPPPVGLSGASHGIATVSGVLGGIYGQHILVTQEVVEVALDRGSRDWRMMQLVVEADAPDWVLPTGRILSAQFV